MPDRISPMADNAGATHEHRVLNYLALRYPAIYAMAAEGYSKNSSFGAVEVRSSSLSNVRKMVDVIFSFTDRNTDLTEKFFVRVDVTEKFPCSVPKMASYVDR
jgi:PatG C-terminal